MSAAATTDPTPRHRAAALPPEERRSTIISATIPLLLAHGDAVTTRQIAEATGIAEGTIFRVFPDKDAVIRAAIESATDAVPLDEELATIDDRLDFGDRLIAATEIVHRRVLTIWRLLSAVGPRYHDQNRRPQADSPALVALFEAERDRLSIDPAVAARLLRSLTLSLTHPLLADTPMSAPEIVDLFLHGVAKDHTC